jgi:bifunctional pyridoxal-dependent enzyme with beta-cystathionase and maltose regulon repressor activities
VRDIELTADDFMFFVERAVNGMRDILTELGDELANQAPDWPGANTPYAVLTHCLGVIGYWGGHVVAGREVHRDRDSEFTASGPVAELTDRIPGVLTQLREDIAASQAGAGLAREPTASTFQSDRPLTRDGALVHILEELAQHRGQLEGVRDALLARKTQNSSFSELSMSWLRAKRGIKWHGPGPALLPAWVADMDFPVAPVIADAIGGAVSRGDLGYPDWDENPLAGPFAERMSARYGWSPDPGQVRGVIDIIQGLQIVLSLTTQPGDGVATFVPCYPPFLETITAMRRRLVPIRLTPDGGWDRDVPPARVLLLVNPHNPTGKTFDADELACIAELADRQDLTVVCDEIHAELVHRPSRHRPFATFSPRRAVTLTSASKAFNVAGLRAAIAHVGPDELRAAWDAQPPEYYGTPNVLGVEATLAAWRHGQPWLDAVTTYLTGQRDHLFRRLAELPGVTAVPPRAGYLAWLDWSGAGLPEAPAAWFREHAGVELSPGSDFGAGNEDYARLNFATSRDVLDQIIDALRDALARR